ncbi:unnamed protein product [Prunus armeniaca]
MSSRFKRSGKTISRYFYSILDGVIRLQGRILKVPEPIPNNCTDNRWRWFKKCLGVLDGTYIRVRVPEQDKPIYRTRKGEVATNVLGVCTPDMKFIFVFPGWEGSASDSRVLRDAISRPTGLRVPTRCYYLVDGGYTNGQGYLAPYRGMESGQSSQSKRSRRVWKAHEEEALLTILEDVVNQGLRCDNGSFKSGTMIQTEKSLVEKFPNTDFRVVPHIVSKMRLLTVVGVGFPVGMTLPSLLDPDLGEFVVLVEERSCHASKTVRAAMAKKRRESSAHAKSSSATSMADPKVDKSSPEKDAVSSWKNKGKQHFIYFKKEVVEDVTDQTGGAVESMADHADAEKTANQGSPAGISE